MQKLITWNNLLVYLFSIIWFINGLFCKIFNLVPRHQEIVSEILGANYSRCFTIAIGIGEVFMAVWILSRRFSRLSALAQIVLIGAMNILEFFLVPQLLLWGKFNILFAFSFIILVYYQAFFLQPKFEKK